MKNKHETNPAGRRKSLAPYLLAVLGCQAALLFGIQVGSWMPGRVSRGPVPDREVQWKKSLHDPGKEPRLGEPPPAASLLAPQGKRVSLHPRRGEKLAVVFVGDGDTCAARSLSAAWSLVRKETRGLRVLFVVRETEPGAGCRPFGPGIELALDPGDRSAAAFNARWMPRAFLVNDRGLLEYAQPVTTRTTSTPLEVRKLLHQRVATTADPRGSAPVR
jgi:hypothetical protein